MAVGEPAHDGGEPRWQPQRLLTDPQPHLAVRSPIDIIAGEIGDSGDGQAEQEDERFADADVQGHGLVGEAAAQELPAVVVVEKLGGMRVRECRDREPASETVAGGPGEEVAEGVGAS